LTELLTVDTKRREMKEREKSPEYRLIESGSVEVIVGPMFCEKTNEMMRRLRRAVIAKFKVQVFKPIIDNRYAKNKLASHSGHEFEAVPVKDVQQIKKLLEEDTSIVAIDEAQFFNDEIIPFVQELANQKIRVIVAGLDTDFRGEPFGPVPTLMAQAETLDKYHAICMVCGGPATCTQRLIDGEPAKYDDPIVIVGAAELYEARCRGHHEVPGKS
jgi:thymidine kinase